MEVSPKTLDFIAQHLNDDVRQLALKGCPQDVDLPFVLQQIAGHQTARRKLPSWAAIDGLIYPPHINMEQCSSEATARYKANIITRLVHEQQDDKPLRFVDLTGGLGVDFAFICQSLRRETNETFETYVEQNAQLCAISSHNLHLLGINAEVVCADATDYLRQMKEADVIYLDPARRDSHGAKTFAISDCTPDVLSLREELLRKSRFTVVKLSPMLDWHEAVRQLRHVSEVHIIATRGECKELLVVMQANSNKLTVTCVNDDEIFVFDGNETNETTRFAKESDMKTALGEGALYLYEPNAALMKAGCFGILAKRFGVEPVGRNSHLFVSPHFIDSFPGRKLRITAISSMNKREWSQRAIGLERANVAVRNFPMKAEELRRRLKLKDGGNSFVYGTTLADGHHRLFFCTLHTQV